MRSNWWRRILFITSLLGGIGIAARALGSRKQRSDVELTADMSLDYLRRLYDDVLGWYKIADSKAQLVLSLDGAFITIVSATIFVKPNEIVARKNAFNAWTWMFLGVSAAAIICSVVCALMCLHSRISTARIGRVVQDSGVDPQKVQSYKPDIAWWFGFIAVLPREQIVGYLKTITSDLERSGRAGQVALLSVNVLHKHRWVNRGWLLSAISLIAILGSGISYVLGA
jgi:hypothetical protein